MAKAKKVILFIVEGSTDETAFGLLFERVLRNMRLNSISSAAI